MAQFYFDKRREDDTYALPDGEVFYHDCTDPCPEAFRHCDECAEFECGGPGWYYWACSPGCLPDSDPIGPFDTKEEAIEDAREGMDE